MNVVDMTSNFRQQRVEMREGMFAERSWAEGKVERHKEFLGAWYILRGGGKQCEWRYRDRNAWKEQEVSRGLELLGKRGCGCKIRAVAKKRQWDTSEMRYANGIVVGWNSENPNQMSRIDGQEWSWSVGENITSGKAFEVRVSALIPVGERQTRTCHTVQGGRVHRDWGLQNALWLKLKLFVCGSIVVIDGDRSIFPMLTVNRDINNMVAYLTNKDEYVQPGSNLVFISDATLIPYMRSLIPSAPSCSYLVVYYFGR